VGAGTNLKVVANKAPEKKTILALKTHLVVLVSAFVMVSAVKSVSCLLFFY